MLCEECHKAIEFATKNITKQFFLGSETIPGILVSSTSINDGRNMIFAADQLFQNTSGINLVLGSSYVDVRICNNNGSLMIPDQITVTGSTSLALSGIFSSTSSAWVIYGRYS